MSYLQSYEYREGKDQLTNEYKEKFLMIENYYIQTYTEGSYEIQITLSQILDDFLQAQTENKPLEKMIGNDIKSYAILMLESETDRDKGKNTVFSKIVTGFMFLWLLLFLIFSKTFFFSDLKHAAFSDKINNLSLGFFEIILILLACGCEILRLRVAKALFYHPKLSYLLRFLFVLPYTLLMSFYFNRLPKNTLSIHVPGIPFFILFGLITIIIVILMYLSYKKTASKKSQLTESKENLIPEQIVCPKCNQIHDYDYPKCPHCGYKVLNIK